LVAAEFLMLGGLLLFVLIAYGLERALTPDLPVRLGPVSALLMAGVPALLWLGYFYSQDRVEPEPKSYVLGCYLLGGFVAAPSAAFLVALSGPAATGMQVLSAERWIYAIAIVGIAQESCKYLVVRYSLYLSPEFDEPLDGIIYMSAAGIGFATYESLQYLQGSGGEIFLSAGAAQCVVTTLAHASFAGVLGFALGRAKFPRSHSPHRSVTILVGLMAAALLNGCFQMIMDALSVQGLDASPWRRVFFSFGFAAGVFVVTSILMRQLLAVSPHAADADEKTADDEDETQSKEDSDV
jgi:RsiW-degrading membrane proteinase PrsW (M82 family)